MNKKDMKTLKKSNPTTDWKLGTLLGKGSFGSVFLATNSVGEIFAAKICDVKNNEELQDLKNEIDILTRCNHKNILSAQASYFYDKKIWMILELCDGGSLDDVVEKMEGLDEMTTKAVTYQSFKGLEYLHNQAIIHRDIKAGNIMLTKDGNLKLADFGVSAILSHARELRNTFIGTPYWMAPEAVAVEAIVGSKYGSKVDIWSMGITVLECVEVLPPNSDYSPIQVLLVCTKAPPPTPKEPENWSKEMLDFLNKVLVKDPSRRPDATKCLEHSWLECDDAWSMDKILELYKLSKAFDNDTDFEVVQDDFTDLSHRDIDESSIGKQVDLDTSSESGYPSLLKKTPKQEELGVARRPTKTIRKTVKCEVNGVIRVKSVIKVVDEDNKNDRQHAKSIQHKIINQIKNLKLEEHREQKKLLQSHEHLLQESKAKYREEEDMLIEKYKNEADAFNKVINKEIEKKKNAYKVECDKNVKKIRLTNQKEVKKYFKGSKRKDSNSRDDEFTSKLQTDSYNKFMQNIEFIRGELSKINVNLIVQKDEKLKSLLHHNIMTKMNHTLEFAQIQRSQICAQLEVALQHKLKIDVKEQVITAKYMSDVKEQLIQQHIRISKMLPKIQRSHLKKILDAHKKSLRVKKVKNEKELMQEKQDEIISQLASEAKNIKQKHEEEIKNLEKDHENQLKDIRLYQDTKNKAVYRMYQELLYNRFIEDEKIFKNLLKGMYDLKKSREEEYKKELVLAQKIELEFAAAYTKTNF